MAFVTKVDYSDNRQIKQYLLTDTQLSGTTTFGIADALIPLNVSGDTINIDALQYIQARGIILPNSIPEFTGTTYQNLGRDNATGKIVAITGATTGVTTNIYTSDGSIPATTLRRMEVPTGSTVQFIESPVSEGSAYFDFTTGEFSAFRAVGVNDIVLQSADHYIDMYSGSRLTLGSSLGLNFTLPIAPVAGQVLMSEDTNGNVIWGTISGGTSGGTNTDDYTVTAILSGTTLEFTRVSGGTYNVDLSSIAGGTSTFLGLTDTPATYSGSGNYLVGVTSGATGLEFTLPTLKAENQGNGVGYFIATREPTKYSPIGSGAIDLTITGIGEPDSDYGVESAGGFSTGGGNKLPITASNFGTHQAHGYGNTVYGYYGNMAFGVFNTITNGYNFVTFGYSNSATMTATVGHGFSAGGFNSSTSYWNNALGFRISASAKGFTGVGLANTVYSGSATATDRPAFTVGIGDAVSSAGPSYGNVISRKDGLVVKFNAEVTVPETTTTIIDNEPTGKVLVTREWVTGHTATLGKRIVSSGVTTSYNFDHSLASDWKIYMTGVTAFSDSNLPTGDTTIEFSIKLTGNFAVTWPAYWDVIGDTYDGAIWNFIAVQIHDGNSGTEEATAFISNIV